MNIVVGPWYRSVAFWTTLIGAIAAILGGIFSTAQVELFTSAAALVIAYLVSRGVVVAAAARAAGAASANRTEYGTEKNVIRF